MLKSRLTSMSRRRDLLLSLLLLAREHRGLPARGRDRAALPARVDRPAQHAGDRRRSGAAFHAGPAFHEFARLEHAQCGARPRQQCGLRQRPGLCARRAAADRGGRRLVHRGADGALRRSRCRGGSPPRSTDKFRVYSFAGSGAPLSQYLVWAGYAVKEYGARAVVINVVGNDFDESLSAYRLGPGFWQYAPDANGVLQLTAQSAPSRHADLARPPQRACALRHHQSRYPEPPVRDPLRLAN